MQFQGRLAGEQGDAVVAFLPVVVDVVAERLDLGLGNWSSATLVSCNPITSGWCRSISAANWCGRARRPLILKETIFMVGVLAKTGMLAQPGMPGDPGGAVLVSAGYPMAVWLGALPALWSAADGDGQAIRSTNRRGEACVSLRLRPTRNAFHA